MNVTARLVERFLLPRYLNSAERIARLQRLHNSVMSQWENGLVLGGDNHFNGVYVPMLLGLIDIANLAEKLADDPATYRPQMRRAIEKYLRDLDIAKAYGQRDIPLDAPTPTAQALELLNRERTNPYSDGSGSGDRWAGWVEGFDAARAILREAGKT